jgi:gliding motility-associated-like protein
MFFRSVLSTLLLVFLAHTLKSQEIIDPCFLSVPQLGFYYGSDDVKNVCDCIDYKLASDMMEWNGSWAGVVANNTLTLAPPPGCYQRAIWMGYDGWTPKGEGVALRLTKGFEAGKTYSFTFTYASDGNGSNGRFSPRVYTNSKVEVRSAVLAGRLPEVNNWTTNTFTFTAQPNQEGHNWLILYAFESSGMVLGECTVQKLYPGVDLLGEDKLICAGDEVTLSAPLNKNYTYSWNTGDDRNSITATQAGTYEVSIKYGDCETTSSVIVELEDCEVRLVMPNIFTPNNDGLNEQFLPKEYNYIEKGWMKIYSRWGNEIYAGDLFEGWNGVSNNGMAANDVYFYLVNYVDLNNKSHQVKGLVTLVR